MATDDAVARQELADSVSLAFLVMLEALNPVERAVFLLHDVFQYSFDEVAAIVDKSSAACRQIASRARTRIAANRPRAAVSPAVHRQLVGQFLTACQSGDLAALQEVLADDVVAYSDGGRTAAARVPIVGLDRVTRFILGLRTKAERYGVTVELKIANVNGLPGIVRYVDGQLHSVVSLEVDGGRIRRLYSILNPDKLASFGAGQPFRGT